MKEATRIVAKLTGDLNEQALKRKIRYNDGEKPTARYEILRLEKHYQRALADRHADCVVLGEDVADEGNYFGASRSQEPGHERVKLGELRAWSAAMLIAEACEADVDLADQIFKCRPESYFWEVWSQSTRGYVHRFAINEKAVAYAARRLRRGLAPEAWPPDVAPPNAEEVANLAHDLADTVAGAALVWVEIAANECEAFPAEAAPPSVEAFIGGIADAAMSMFVSTTMNPRRRFQAGWDAASKYLPPEWTAFALLSATEQLDRLGYWPHQRCLDVLQAGAYMPPDDGDPPCQPPI